MPPPPLRAERVRAQREAEEREGPPRRRRRPSPGDWVHAATAAEASRGRELLLRPLPAYAPRPRYAGAVEPTERLVANPAEAARIAAVRFQTQTYPLFDGSDLLAIDVLVLDGDVQVGNLWANETPVADLKAGAAFEYEPLVVCLADFVAVELRAGFPLRPFIVRDTDLEPFYQEKGLGIALYRAATIAAGRQRGALLASDCTLGGTTSEEAYRVWESSRFARGFTVAGTVAYAPQ